MKRRQLEKRKTLCEASFNKVIIANYGCRKTIPIHGGLGQEKDIQSRRIAAGEVSDRSVICKMVPKMAPAEVLSKQKSSFCCCCYFFFCEARTHTGRSRFALLHKSARARRSRMTAAKTWVDAHTRRESANGRGKVAPLPPARTVQLA